LIVFKSACQNEKFYVFRDLELKFPIDELIFSILACDLFSDRPNEP